MKKEDAVLNKLLAAEAEYQVVRRKVTAYVSLAKIQSQLERLIEDAGKDKSQLEAQDLTSALKAVKVVAENAQLPSLSLQLLGCNLNDAIRMIRGEDKES